MDPHGIAWRLVWNWYCPIAIASHDASVIPGRMFEVLWRTGSSLSNQSQQYQLVNWHDQPISYLKGWSLKKWSTNDNTIWVIIQSLRIAVFEPINLYRPWFFEKHIKINISNSTNQNHPEFGDTNVNIWSTPNGCSTFKQWHPGLSFSGQAATGGLHVPAKAGFHPKCLGTFLDLPGICR